MSHLKRIFRISSTNKVYLSEKENDFDPSSVCLVNMVTNFIEEENDKQSVTKCGRTRCNCFHGNNTYSSDDDEFLHCNDYEEIYDFSEGNSLNFQFPPIFPKFLQQLWLYKTRLGYVLEHVLGIYVTKKGCISSVSILQMLYDRFLA